MSNFNFPDLCNNALKLHKWSPPFSAGPTNERTRTSIFIVEEWLLVLSNTKALKTLSHTVQIQKAIVLT